MRDLLALWNVHCYAKDSEPVSGGLSDGER